VSAEGFFAELLQQQTKAIFGYVIERLADAAGQA
jgi:hypothetical protein